MHSFKFNHTIPENVLSEKRRSKLLFPTPAKEINKTYAI